MGIRNVVAYGSTFIAGALAGAIISQYAAKIYTTYTENELLAREDKAIIEMIDEQFKKYATKYQLNSKFFKNFDTLPAAEQQRRNDIYDHLCTFSSELDNSVTQRREEYWRRVINPLDGGIFCEEHVQNVKRSK